MADYAGKDCNWEPVATGDSSIWWKAAIQITNIYYISLSTSLYLTSSNSTPKLKNGNCLLPRRPHAAVPVFHLLPYKWTHATPKFIKWNNLISILRSLEQTNRLPIRQTKVKNCANQKNCIFAPTKTEESQTKTQKRQYLKEDTIINPNTSTKWKNQSLLSWEGLPSYR